MSIFRYLENEQKDVHGLPPARGSKAERILKDYYKSMLRKRNKQNRSGKGKRK
ncbi:MAG: hypothetical protein RIG77_03310 [Cyclobacteriaceae bacterium]